MARVLLLHPGEMGISVGAALKTTRHETFWVTHNRGEMTRARAEEHNLTAVPTLEEALAKAEVVISVCPPDAAKAVAESVRHTGYSGRYVDANAVSPATALEIGAIIGEGFVDGGIIGPPAWQAGVMRFYLSGADAAEIAALFEGTPVDARVCAGEIGAASALKMSYAAYAKGSSALILGVRALAEFYGVSNTLVEEWNISIPGMSDRSAGVAQQTSRKAWRFAGEMAEIADTFDNAGLPDGFHRAAHDLYARLSSFKDQTADLEAVITQLLGRGGQGK